MDARTLCLACVHVCLMTLFGYSGPLKRCSPCCVYLHFQSFPIDFASFMSNSSTLVSFHPFFPTPSAFVLTNGDII